MVETERSLLVTDQQSLQPGQVFEADVDVPVLSVVRISELHLNLVQHVVLDIACNAKAYTTPFKAVLGADAWSSFKASGIVAVREGPPVGVNSTGDLHRGV